jgi:hypothetical protein
VKLSLYDLQQLDEAALWRLPEAALRHLSQTLLADLKEARERLAQNPPNSTRPPSSRGPWEYDPPAEEPAPADTAPAAAALPPAAPPVDAPAATPPSGGGTTRNRRDGQAEKRQAGAPGIGRTQVYTAHHIEEHRPAVCAPCGQPLSATAPAVSYTGFQALDLDGGDAAAPGLRLRVINHRYLDVTCPCGHHSRAQPAHGAVGPALGAVAVREWRPVWPPSSIC